jgi:hypothetical protein
MALGVHQETRSLSSQDNTPHCGKAINLSKSITFLSFPCKVICHLNGACGEDKQNTDRKKLKV